MGAVSCVGMETALEMWVEMSGPARGGLRGEGAGTSGTLGTRMWVDSRAVLRVRQGSLLVEGVRREGEGTRAVVLNLGRWFQRCPGGPPGRWARGRRWGLRRERCW